MRPVWIFCKGQCNFIIIQLVHTLLCTWKVMYADICSDLHAPPNTHMHLLLCRRLGPVHTRLRQEHLSTPLSSLAQAHPCCHLQADGYSKENSSLLRNPEEPITPRPPALTMETSKSRRDLWRASVPTIPNTLSQGFPVCWSQCLSFALVGET